jgi:single-strand DNA-binding protein
MSGLPEITVAGNVVAAPELNHTNSGIAVANFRVAANDRRYNQQTGEWENAGVTFLRCSIWRQGAYNVSDSLNTGDRVLVTGVLRQSEWETKEGEKRTSYELAVSEIGISLKFATAKSNKATRSTAGEQTSADDPFASAGSSTSDPWASGRALPAAVSAGGGFSNEPPF